MRTQTTKMMHLDKGIAGSHSVSHMEPTSRQPLHEGMNEAGARKRHKDTDNFLVTVWFR
jgi:hypothetical protein